jgi:hypothetical protein
MIAMSSAGGHTMAGVQAGTLANTTQTHARRHTLLHAVTKFWILLRSHLQHLCLFLCCLLRCLCRLKLLSQLLQVPLLLFHMHLSCCCLWCHHRQLRLGLLKLLC